MLERVAEHLEAGPAPTPPVHVSRRQRRLLLGAALVALIPAVGLVVLGVLTGLEVRPLADDWCLAWPARDDGLVAMTRTFYTETNGRAANAAVNALVFSQGLLGPKLLPGLVLVGLGAGTALLVLLVLRACGRPAPLLPVVTAATGLTALLGHAPKDSYQVLYWAPGSITHTLPSLLLVWSAVAALLVRGRGRGPRLSALVLAALVGFVIGSLSEAFVVVSGLVVAAGVVVLRPWRRGAERFLAWWGVAWCVGLGAGFLLLLTSPGLAHRQRVLHQPALLSGDGLADLLRQWGSTWDAVAHRPAYLGVLALGVLLGIASRSADTVVEPHRPGARRWGLAGLAVLVVAVASLAVIAGLRQGYGPNGWSYARTWTNFLYPVLLVLLLLGFLVGEELGQRLRSGAVVVAGFGAALLGTGALLAVLPSATDLAEQVRTRAQGWDRQNARIEREVRAGAREVSYTPRPLGGLLEPFFYDPRADWQKWCVAGWYGVDEVEPSTAWVRTEDAARYRYYVRRNAYLDQLALSPD
jgi:hypothetical protein